MKVITPAAEEILLGTTEATPTISMIDYSRRVTDDFGTTMVVPRGFSRRLSVRVAVPFDSVTSIQDQLAALRATPATWIADDELEWLQVEGFYKDFSIDLNVPPLSFCTLTVEGLAETETVVDAGGDPAPTGQSSSLMLVQPLAVTTSTLASVSVPETEWPDWTMGATYFQGSRVIRAHRVYESLKPANIGHDPILGDGWWLDTGATNAWAMFDEALGSATTAADQVQAVFNPIAINAVAVLDAVGSTVRVQAPAYDQTLPIGEDGKALFLDLPITSGAGNLTVTIAGVGQVSVGTLMMGTLVPLGVTEASPTAGITDYSRKETDDFGEVTVVERSWSKKMAVRGLIRTDAIDLVANRIASVRTRPSLWIGDDAVGSLIIYGFFKDFSIERGEEVSTLSLSIEGLSKASQLSPAFGGPIYWSDILGPNKPDDNADVTADNISSGFVGQGPGATAADLAEFDPSAATALQSVVQAISNIGDDNLISTAEKWPLMEVHRQYSALYSSARSTSLSLATSYPDDPTAAERTAAQTALDNLNAYLAGLVPSWSDPAVNTPVNGATLRAHFQAAATTVAALMAANINIGSQRAQIDGRIYDMATGNFLTRAGLITALGISAGITGQGTLATQSNVNLASQVTGLLGLANADAGLVNANVPVGSNIIVNSSFQRGLFGWYFSGSAGGSINLNYPGYFGTREVAYLFHSGMMTTVEYADAVTKAEVNGFADMRRYALPVKPGDQIGASMLAAHHRCRPELLVVFYDSAGAYVGVAGVFMTGSIANGGVGGESLGRMSFTHTVPENARYAAIRARMYGNDEENAYLFFAEPWLGVLAPNQTTVPAYSPGPPDFLATMGSTAGADLFRSDGSTVMSQAEVRTPEGVSAGFVGQGWGATADQKLLDNGYVQTVYVRPWGAAVSGNSITRSYGNSDYSAAAYADRINGPCFVSQLITASAWNMVSLDDDLANSDWSSMRATVHYHPTAAGGVLTLYLNGSSVFNMSENAGNWSGADLRLVYDGSFFRVTLGGYEVTTYPAPANLALYPVWHAYNAVSYYNLNAGPARSAARIGVNTYDNSGALRSSADLITLEGISSGFTGQGWAATQGEAATSNALVPVGANVVVNSSFQRGLFGWHFGGSAGGVLGINSPSYSGARSVAYINHDGEFTPAEYADAFTQAETNFDAMKKYALPVKPGDRVGASMLMGHHRCSPELLIVYYDGAGAYVLAHTASAGSTANGGAGGENLGRVSMCQTVPANARYATIRARMSGTGESNAYLFFAEAWLGVLGANQTAVPAYSPGPPDYLATRGSTSGTDLFRADGSTVMTQAEVRTPEGISAGFTGQGALATQNSVAYGSGFVTGFGTFAALSQINAGNITSYFANQAIGSAVIANAAIGTAHVDQIDVSKIVAGSLDALSGTIGLLRTRTTGARLELASNEIRSYHSNGQIAFILSGEA